MFAEMVETSLHVLPVTGMDFRVAARFADQISTAPAFGRAMPCIWRWRRTTGGTAGAKLQLMGSQVELAIDHSGT